MVESIVDFPLYMEELKSTFNQIKEYKKTSAGKSGDIADIINLTKNLIIRAENSRIMNNIYLLFLFSTKHLMFI